MDTKLLGLILQGDKKNEREFNRIKETYEELSKSKANTITSSANGESIVLSDSSDSKLDNLRVLGKSEQFTTTGAQLANLPDCELIELNGITWTCKGGVVTAKGTSTSISPTQGFIHYDLPIVAGTYYVSGGNNISVGVGVYVEIKLADGTDKWFANHAFTIDGTEKQVRIYCQVNNGKTVNETVYPMLNKGTTALPWEPYTGGIPSPNPQYPQKLETIGTSKNLLENLGQNIETNGIKFIRNDDGSVTANGTSTNVCYFGVYGEYRLPVGDYVVSDGLTNHSAYFTRVTIIRSNGATEYIDSSSFVINAGDYVRDVNIVVRSGNTLDNVTFYPMLNEGTTALLYKPYGQGDIEVGVHGKNLLDYDTWSKIGLQQASGTCEWKDYGIAIMATQDDTYTRYNVEWGNIYPLPCSPNTAYTMSWEWSGNNNDRVYVFFNGASESNVNVRSNVGSITFTTPEDATFFTFRVGCFVAGTTSIYKNVRINLGDTVLPFEPYKPAQPLTIPTPNGLPGIKVTDPSIATYTDEDGQMWCADEIDFERGVYVKRIESRRLLSTDDWSTYNANGRYWLANYKFNDLSESVFCTHFKSATSWEEHTSTFHTCIIYKGKNWSAGRLSFNTTFASLDDWKTFLSNNELYVMYQLATPIETPLSESELEAYKSLHTNYPTTTILNDSGAHMEVKYTADKKNYIDNKFAQITNAVLSMGGNI